MIARSASLAAAQIGSRSGSSTGRPSGSNGHTAATQSSFASSVITCAAHAGSVAGASTMLFRRRGSATHADRFKEGEGDHVPTVSVNGLQIAYASAGAGPPTVCLVHGTGGSSDVWMRQLEDLADLGRIVALDLPGHGGSGGTIAHRIEDAAAVVAGFLDALGITRVVIGGHSMGGAIAQQFALSCRERQ